MGWTWRAVVLLVAGIGYAAFTDVPGMNWFRYWGAAMCASCQAIVIWEFMGRR